MLRAPAGGPGRAFELLTRLPDDFLSDGRRDAPLQRRKELAARYLLDTNICIYTQRQRPPAVLERFRKLKPGEAVISVITWAELRHGAEKSRQRDMVLALLEEFTAMVPVMPMPEAAGQACGTIRAALEAKGAPIGNNDLWIAAHAKASGLITVTSNEREFEQVPGFGVRSWA